MFRIQDLPKFNHRMFSTNSYRKFWLNTHLILALAVGFVFVVFGLTGSCNVFYYELGEIGLPSLPDKQQSHRLSLDDILQTVKARHPQRTGHWSIVLPGYQSDYVWVEYPKPEETKDELFAPLEIIVDPFEGKIVAEQFWGRTLTSLIYEVHATFLTGKLGVEIGKAGFKAVCFFGVFLFVSCLSGIYLWWPRGGKFRQSFTIKRNSSPERFYFDLHKTFGIYGSAWLLVIAFTGFSFAYKDYLKPLVNLVSTIKEDHLKEPKLKSTMTTAQPISIAQAIAVADRVFPDAELRMVNTPDGADGVYMIAKHQIGEANRKRPRSKVWIDQYSGKVLAVQDPNQFTAGETFFNLLWPLHDGQAFGLPGRILWCIAGFVPFILYVTGIIRWLQKRRAKQTTNRQVSKAA